MSLKIGLTDDIATCQSLRYRVFVEEQGVSLADEQDGRDAEAMHMLARLESVPVGTARILVSGETAKIGRVCVLAEHRKAGLGRGLIAACLDHLRQQPDIRRAVLGAQVHALPFYEQLGFTAFGPEYEEINTPHQNMEQSV